MPKLKIERRSVRINPRSAVDFSTKELPNHDEWILAKGSCGFNIGSTSVYAAYVNGVALFAFEYAVRNKPHFSCVVTGQLLCGGKSLHEAMDAGALEALKWGVLDADQRFSRKKFQEVIDNPVRLS